jgi:transmembrane sensor
MPNTRQRLQYLLERNANRSCTREEMLELYSFIASTQDEELYPLMDEQFEKIDPETTVADIDWDHMLKQIMASTPVVAMRPSRMRRLWRRFAVAASVILVISVASYFLFFNKDIKQPEIVENSKVLNDVKPPENNKAMITLADGRKVYLDSVSDGSLVMQGNVSLIKLGNGQIVYRATTGGITDMVQYNTLTNPKGSKVIDMALADGSHVWLNAGSSVMYPIAFVGNERKIIITGEAYFEVAHDIAKPFIVSKGEMRVQVLGTHFNVNAYDDEDDIRVSLLEGSVSVTGGKDNVVIRPGQQVKVASDLRVIDDVDLEQVMAWKNGKFSFNRSDMKSVMRDLMRWYDIEVVYEGNVTDRYFTADISRDKSLASILKIFDQSNIKFKIEGKRLTVMP